MTLFIFLKNDGKSKECGVCKHWGSEQDDSTGCKAIYEFQGQWI